MEGRVVSFVMRRGQQIEVDTVEIKTPRARVRRPQQPYVQVPRLWLERLRTSQRISTYRLALYLLFEFWRNGGRPIRVANGVVAQHGLDRTSKVRALRELEQMALITVEWRDRKSPLVTRVPDTGQCQT